MWSVTEPVGGPHGLPGPSAAWHLGMPRGYDEQQPQEVQTDW